jgi:hypothetical protein
VASRPTWVLAHGAISSQLYQLIQAMATSSSARGASLVSQTADRMFEHAGIAN